MRSLYIFCALLLLLSGVQVVAADGTATVPVADFMAIPSTGVAPMVVQFSDVSTGSPTSWSWEFGDDTTSLGQNPVHTYAAAGTYLANLTVTNAAGSDTRTMPIIVKNLQASFRVSMSTGLAPLSIQFSDASLFSNVPTACPTSWLWDFGDGSTSPDQNPTHIYATAGDYPISLVVTNNRGDSDAIYVRSQLFVADAPGITTVADYTSTQTAPLTVQFTDKSTKAEQVIWNFGDGTAVSTAQNPSHTYTTPGTYTVSLEADNFTTGRWNIKTMSITVTPDITVKTPAEATSDLITQVKSLEIKKGIETALSAKLNAAIAALDRGNEKTAINNLNAFINLVEAQKGKALAPAQADTLITEAQKIVQSI